MASFFVFAVANICNTICGCCRRYRRCRRRRRRRRRRHTTIGIRCTTFNITHTRRVRCTAGSCLQQQSSQRKIRKNKTISIGIAATWIIVAHNLCVKNGLLSLALALPLHVHNFRSVNSALASRSLYHLDSTLWLFYLFTFYFTLYSLVLLFFSFFQYYVPNLINVSILLCKHWIKKISALVFPFWFRSFRLIYLFLRKSFPHFFSLT